MRKVYFRNTLVIKSRKRGRPGKLTPELRESIYQHILNGWSFNDALSAVGIHRVTGWRWLNKFPEFSETVQGANEKYQKDRLEKFLEEVKEDREQLEGIGRLPRRRKRVSEGRYPVRARDECGRFKSI